MSRRYCHAIIDGGCGLPKNLDTVDWKASDFTVRSRPNRNGEMQLQISHFCKECVRRRETAKRGANCADRPKHRHTGPQDPIQRLFFCELRGTG